MRASLLVALFFSSSTIGGCGEDAAPVTDGGAADGALDGGDGGDGGGFLCECCGTEYIVPTADDCEVGACDPFCMPAEDSGVDGGDAGDAGFERIMEAEPNGGASVDEVNDLPMGTIMEGVIGAPEDSDIFRIPTAGGRAYRVILSSGAALMGHLTILDSGRGGDPAGDDYVHLSRTGRGTDVSLDLLAMGDGHLVAVRDLRSLDGGTGSGGADHSYELRVEPLDLEALPTGIALPSSLMFNLEHPGAMNLFRFDGGEGTGVIFDLATTGDVDARLYIVAQATGSWIARNDDRGALDDTPLIDAPLTASGRMYLLVENINELATLRTGTIAASSD